MAFLYTLCYSESYGFPFTPKNGNVLLCSALNMNDLFEHQV
jgi:hypothetical protein